MKKDISFPAELDSILKRLEEVNPPQYARTRNFINGSVTYLSPYLSRGVISLRQVVEKIKERGFDFSQSEKLVQELAWREYFQRVLQAKPDLDTSFIRQEQAGPFRQGMPRAIIEAATGIEAIDLGILRLYETGYMHNHLRMYVASMACNMAKCHWTVPARWMYYHLLDADPASNFCSWQWVCGSFSSKTYLANQENINRYCNSNQAKTFLDVSYETLANMDIPEVLKMLQMPWLDSGHVNQQTLDIDPAKPVLLYNIFNLDPFWHREEDVNRVLLLDSDLLSRVPLSVSVMNFILSLTVNIPGIVIWSGSFSELQRKLPAASFIFKEHPWHQYKGKEEERDWLFPRVSGYHPSFSAYWKKCMKHAKNLFE